MKWYEIKSKADKSEIWIYDFIGEDSWTGAGVTAKAFAKDLAGIKASDIDLHINSPGGDVFDGLAIYNLLKRHPANITTYIDGLAASIASVIALAGDTIYMAENALFMIHNPWTVTVGDEEEHEKALSLLGKVKGSIVGAYVLKTDKDEEEIRDMMREETWLTADEAFEYGFVDEVEGSIDMAACVRFLPTMAKAGFKQIPEAIQRANHVPTAKDADKALRNAGFSRKQTKMVLAKGISEYLRNVDGEDVTDQVDESLRNVDDITTTNEEKGGIKAPSGSVEDLLIQAEIIAPKHKVEKENQ